MLALLVVSLMACRSETAVPTPATSISEPVITQELAATKTPLPTATKISPLPTTEINSGVETATTIASSELEATQEISRALPLWILKPGANILLLVSQENQTISLLNVDSGELHVTFAQAYGEPQWFWDNGRYYLKFGSDDPKFLDLTTRNYVTLPSKGSDVVSPDGRYGARFEKREDQSELVKIINYELQTEVELPNPFHNYQTREEEFVEYARAFWSPDGAFLSVVYFTHYYSDNEDTHLAIYTPTGELFRQYTNVSPTVYKPWSPVSPYRILFTGQRSVPPCILEIVGNQQTCLATIAEWADEQVVVPSFYTWSPNGKQISFDYSTDRPSTGLCYYVITREELVCPVKTEDLFFDKQFFVRKHYWSPDGRYLVLFFDNLGIIDVVGTVKAAVVNIETGDIQFIEGDYSFPYDDPWRPLMP